MSKSFTGRSNSKERMKESSKAGYQFTVTVDKGIPARPLSPPVEDSYESRRQQDNRRRGDGDTLGPDPLSAAEGQFQGLLEL